MMAIAWLGSLVTAGLAGCSPEQVALDSTLNSFRVSKGIKPRACSPGGVSHTAPFADEVAFRACMNRTGNAVRAESEQVGLMVECDSQLCMEQRDRARQAAARTWDVDAAWGPWAPQTARIHPSETHGSPMRRAAGRRGRVAGLGSRWSVRRW